jgi:hypothetical protein
MLKDPAVIKNCQYVATIYRTIRLLEKELKNITETLDSIYPERSNGIVATAVAQKEGE